MHLALYSVCTASSAKRCLDGDLQRGGVARSRARENRPAWARAVPSSIQNAGKSSLHKWSSFVVR